MDWHIPRPSLTILPHNPDKYPQNRDFEDSYKTGYTVPKYARSLQNEPLGKNRINGLEVDRRYSGTISTYFPASTVLEWTQADYDFDAVPTKTGQTNNIQHENNLDDNTLQQNISPKEFDLNFDLKKDMKKDNSDSASVASSTHFTMINDSRYVGQGSYLHRSNKNSKIHSPFSFFCLSCKTCQGHKLTCLVLTMSFFILTGLAIAILFIEYRARRIQE